MIEWSLSTSGTCRSYKKVPKGATIEAVNGQFHVGVCAYCGKHIIERNGKRADYRTDSESGMYFCSRCYPKMKEDE